MRGSPLVSNQLVLVLAWALGPWPWARGQCRLPCRAVGLGAGCWAHRALGTGHENCKSGCSTCSAADVKVKTKLGIRSEFRILRKVGRDFGTPPPPTARGSRGMSPSGNPAIAVDRSTRSPNQFWPQSATSSSSLGTKRCTVSSPTQGKTQEVYFPTSFP